MGNVTQAVWLNGENFDTPLSLDRVIEAFEERRAEMIRKETHLQSCFALLQAHIAKMKETKHELCKQRKNLLEEKSEIKRQHSSNASKETELENRAKELEARREELNAMKRDLEQSYENCQVSFLSEFWKTPL